MNNSIKCHGCYFFYITYKQSKPYGCKAYGFISKILPAKVVFDSSGGGGTWNLIQTQTASS